ncbi:hypothetical protein FACS189449_12000 [Alphaproteobacteria bacterium]|nr:hypothetical protein FACS189449_12000 [Alphaproteobacteria bacterium]
MRRSICGSMIALMLFSVSQSDVHAGTSVSKVKKTSRTSDSKSNSPKSKKKSQDEHNKNIQKVGNVAKNSDDGKSKKESSKKKASAEGKSAKKKSSEDSDDLYEEMAQANVLKNKSPTQGKNDATLSALTVIFGDHHQAIFSFLKGRTDELCKSIKKTLAFLSKDKSNEIKNMPKAICEYLSLFSKQFEYAIHPQRKKIDACHADIQKSNKKTEDTLSTLGTFADSFSSRDEGSLTESGTHTETIGSQLKAISADVKAIESLISGAVAKDGTDEDISSDISDMLDKIAKLKKDLDFLKETIQDKNSSKSKATKEKAEISKKRESLKNTLSSSVRSRRILLTNLKDVKKRVDLVIAKAESATEDAKSITKENRTTTASLFADLETYSAFLGDLANKLVEIEKLIDSNDEDEDDDENDEAEEVDDDSDEEIDSSDGDDEKEEEGDGDDEWTTRARRDIRAISSHPTGVS